ncbi:MAG: 50S ribosomal protein L25/general stress protein Ctc [Holosporales bacterium]
MSKTVAVWQAVEKTHQGTGAARAVRREGKVPAIIYGGNVEPMMVALDPRDVAKGVNQASFHASLYEIEINGKKVTVLPRAVQFHPLNEQPLHVDLQRISGNVRITVEIPVVLLNQDKSKGLKLGGILNFVRHVVEVSCPANAIPEKFEIDISETKIGEAVKSSAITLPKDVQFTVTDRDFTIATIVAPKDEVETKPAEGDAAAGETPAAPSK